MIPRYLKLKGQRIMEKNQGLSRKAMREFICFEMKLGEKSAFLFGGWEAAQSLEDAGYKISSFESHDDAAKEKIDEKAFYLH